MKIGKIGAAILSSLMIAPSLLPTLASAEEPGIVSTLSNEGGVLKSRVDSGASLVDKSNLLVKTEDDSRFTSVGSADREYRDTEVISDTKNPTKIKIEEVGRNGGNKTIRISAKDRGPKYTARADYSTKDKKKYSSNTVSGEAASGIKELRYITSDKAVTEVPATGYKVLANGGSVDVPAKDYSFIHIVAVDNKGNISNTTHYEVRVGLSVQTADSHPFRAGKGTMIAGLTKFDKPLRTVSMKIKIDKRPNNNGVTRMVSGINTKPGTGRFAIGYAYATNAKAGSFGINTESGTWKGAEFPDSLLGKWVDITIVIHKGKMQTGKDPDDVTVYYDGVKQRSQVSGEIKQGVLDLDKLTSSFNFLSIGANAVAQSSTTDIPQWLYPSESDISELVFDSKEWTEAEVKEHSTHRFTADEASKRTSLLYDLNLSRVGENNLDLNNNSLKDFSYFYDVRAINDPAFRKPEWRTKSHIPKIFDNKSKDILKLTNGENGLYVEENVLGDTLGLRHGEIHFKLQNLATKALSKEIVIPTRSKENIGASMNLIGGASYGISGASNSAEVEYQLYGASGEKEVFAVKLVDQAVQKLTYKELPTKLSFVNSSKERVVPIGSTVGTDMPELNISTQKEGTLTLKASTPHSTLKIGSKGEAKKVTSFAEFGTYDEVKEKTLDLGDKSTANLKDGVVLGDVGVGYTSVYLVDSGEQDVISSAEGLQLNAGNSKVGETTVTITATYSPKIK